MKLEPGNAQLKEEEEEEGEESDDDDENEDEEEEEVHSPRHTIQKVISH